MKSKFLAMFATAALLLGMSACTSDKIDNPSSGEGNATAFPAQLKQGVWMEFDIPLEALNDDFGEELDLEALEDISDEELDETAALGMMIEGDKAYFFTYTAEGADELVEGKVSYDKTTGTGSITFPAIKDNALSGQAVNFTMTSDETLQFEYTYGGETVTGGCAWLCENLDGWGEEIADEDWEELLAYYDTISEDAGPDATIDWGDLDEPLVWEEETAATRGNTRAAVVDGVSMGLDMFSPLFEEETQEGITAKLEAVIGKLHNALSYFRQLEGSLDVAQGDNVATMRSFEDVNSRLIDLAKKMNKGNMLDIFNERNDKYYNPLNARNTNDFTSIYLTYNRQKSNLSDRMKRHIGVMANDWAGSNNEYFDLTWQYIDYLSSVKHDTYGTGMPSIYDGLTFDKYPWEHMGIADRKFYRAYDMFVISKCLYMISVYAAWGELTDDQKTEIYNKYCSYKPQLKAFCEFRVSNPDKFLVCQIPGAHFVMHKELQKYYFRKKDNQSPNIKFYGREVVFRPEWHEAGNVKIYNPDELKSKLLLMNEAIALYNYFKAAVYPGQEEISWSNMLVDGNDKAGGAVYAKKPSTGNDDNRRLWFYCPGSKYGGTEYGISGAQYFHDNAHNSYIGLRENVGTNWKNLDWSRVTMGSWHWTVEAGNAQTKYIKYNEEIEYYAAIVEKRY